MAPTLKKLRQGGGGDRRLSLRKVMVWSSCHIQILSHIFVQCVLWSPDCETGQLTATSSLFSFSDVFTCLYLCLLPTEVLWSRPRISTGTPSALCVLIVTSTSSRKVTSSWRGSCIVRCTQEPARGPQKATTPSLCTPKLKFFTDENTHSRMRTH